MHGIARVVFVVLLGAALVGALRQFMVGSPAPPASEPPDRVAAGSAGPPSVRLAGSPGKPAREVRRSGAAVGDGPRLARIDAGRAASVAAAPSSLIIEVRDAFARPLAGAEVTLRPGTRQRSVVTGGDGEAAFENLGAGSYGYRISVPRRPLLMAVAPVRLAAGERRRLRVRLVDRDRVLAGTVVDRNGAPVAGLTVKARLYRPLADAGVVVPETRPEQSAASASDGRFEITGLAAGVYRVGVLASERYLSAEAIARPDSEPVRLVVLERREVTIGGEVTGSKGEAIAGARVIDLERPSRRARTDERGQYTLEVEAGTEGRNERLRFDAEGYRSGRREVDAAALRDLDQVRLDVTLEPLVEDLAVTAHLTDEAGAPVAGERVYLWSPALGTRYQASSDRDGRASFPAVADSGDYALRVLPRGPYQDYAGAMVDLGAPIEIELRPLALAKLGGRMIDAAGQPVPDFSLRLESVNARGKVRQVTGDVGGYFDLEDVPAGPLTFGTLAPVQRISGFDLEPGTEPYVELVLDWGDAEIEGRVVDADQRPVPGAAVALVWADRTGSTRSYAERSTTADAAGAFTFSGLGPGAHELEVRAAGHRRQRQLVPTGVGSTEIRLEPAP